MDAPGGQGQEKGRKLGLCHAFALRGWRVLGGSEWLAEPAWLPPHPPPPASSPAPSAPVPRLTCLVLLLSPVPCTVEGGAIFGPREELHPRAKE